MRKSLRVTACALAVLTVATSHTGFADEFRGVRTINRPPPPNATPLRKVAIDPVQKKLKRVTPVSPRKVEKGVQQLIAAWNQGNLEEFLSEQFYDRSRLQDNIDAFIARDATIRLLGQTPAQTLSQTLTIHPDDPTAAQLKSVVIVTVQTQVEFEDENGQFQTRPSETEMILEVTEKVTPQ